MTLRELAEQLGCRLEGGGDVEIRRVAGIEQAAAGDVTFLSNSKYRGLLATTKAPAVILGLEAAQDPPAPCAVLRSPQPYVAFALAVRLFARPSLPARGIDRLSAIAADATLGPDASVGPFVTIGAGASIGARAVIHPTVIIGPGVSIGDDRRRRGDWRELHDRSSCGWGDADQRGHEDRQPRTHRARRRGRAPRPDGRAGRHRREYYLRG
jgi:UDP-3-O-[3-hydroxymyristoyl] glucosamine N-acyltransferase